MKTFHLVSILVICTLVVLCIQILGQWGDLKAASTRLSEASRPLDKKLSTSHHSQNRTAPYHLTKNITDGIRIFVFFIGHGRSGHSILGSLLNAHPHIVIARDYYIFKRWSRLNDIKPSMWARFLFNLLYRWSLLKEKPTRKGYTTSIEGLWQGKFDEYITVLGDKSGGSTTRQYMKDKDLFLGRYRILKERILIPIRVIHAVRNPFDQIATTLLYEAGNVTTVRELKMLSNSSTDTDASWKYSNELMLEATVNKLFDRFDAVLEMINHFGWDSVIQVHSSELILHPRETISRMCSFLEVDTTERYLDVCAKKVFKKVSRSRDLVVWPDRLRRIVEERMKEYSMFTRYSFTSD